MADSSTDCLPLLRALADRNRLRLVKTLLARPHTVNELVGTLAISQYNVSKHLRVLLAAGIAEVEPKGRLREYSIAGPFARRLAKSGNVLDLGCCTFRFDRIEE